MKNFNRGMRTLNPTLAGATLGAGLLLWPLMGSGAFIATVAAVIASAAVMGKITEGNGSSRGRRHYRR
jgi:hypothetical protein